MKQSRTMSLIEAIVSILVGFGISLTAQVFILPLLGVEISLKQNLTFALIMTAISICRQYVMRRLFEALHIRRPLSPFMHAVIAERYRQIEQEGWSLHADDEHDDGALARAGACYAKYAGNPIHASMGSPSEWPWARQWWKPTDQRRNLVKGCALIIAEGERFDRSKKARGFLALKPSDVPARHRRAF